MGRPPLVLEQDAAELLQDYPWPGNVREMRNVCERLTVLAEQGTVSADVVLQLVDLPADTAGTQVTGEATLAEAVSEAEIAAIRAALEQTGGNKAQAARRLGISERNLWYKIKKYGDRLPT